MESEESQFTNIHANSLSDKIFQPAFALFVLYLCL